MIKQIIYLLITILILVIIVIKVLYYFKIIEEFTTIYITDDTKTGIGKYGVNCELCSGGKGGGGGGGFFDNGFYDPSWGGTGINNGATKLGGKYGNSVSGGNGGELTGGGGGGAFEEDGGDGGSGSIIIVYKCME